MMPYHVNPKLLERTAVAPYNFVPLPNQIYAVRGIESNGENVNPWERHDSFLSGANSGWIDLTMRPLTPLFIRGAVKQGGTGWDDREARLRPEPSAAPDGTPVIPGSSLRGMVRNLVEILSFSRIAPVTNEKPFFRTVSVDRIGDKYKSRMVSGGQRPAGGFIKRQSGRWIIIPAKEVLRVSIVDVLSRDIGMDYRLHPSYKPSWDFQQKQCWFQREQRRNSSVSKISLTQPHSGEWEEGILVLTGSAPRKKAEFVFSGRRTDQAVRIPDRIWKRFHDEDQITQWQEEEFKKDKPTEGCRRAKGHLRDGEPVFFVCADSERGPDNPDGLVFLGRAQMFRLPYDVSPEDLVPEAVMPASLDLADAMFGRVSQHGQQEQAVKSRIFFEDAKAMERGPSCFAEPGNMVPHVLAAPKVTTFQHYLTQDGTKSERDLTTYINGDRTTIRGHKLYWHRWDDTAGLSAAKHPDQESKLADLQSANPKDTQCTLIRPLRAELTFAGRIRFENLTDIELGALLAALRLPRECAHKIGMAKPLGLGSLRIEDARLNLVDRVERYRSWSATGVQADDGTRFAQAFEKEILDHAVRTKETLIRGKSGLRSIARLDVLLLLLTWTGRPPISETRYMVIENGQRGRFPPDRNGKINEYRTDPVLPTPHQVVGAEEPDWSAPRPTAARGTPAAAPTGTAARPRTGVTSKRLDSTAPVPMAPKAIPRKKPVQTGQTMPGTLVQESGVWTARFDQDDRDAVIANADKIPKSASNGARAEFYIEKEDKKGGIRARFQRML